MRKMKEKAGKASIYSENDENSSWPDFPVHRLRFCE
jgi:hypothetical protein